MLDASHGDLNFASGSLPNFYDGTMHIGAGHSITIAANWTNGTGEINLNGGTTYAERAELDGGRIMFEAVRSMSMASARSMPRPASIPVPTSSSTMPLRNYGWAAVAVNDPITYAGGVFRGPGTLVQNGHATVLAGSVVDIEVDRFDWDGTTLSDTNRGIGWSTPHHRGRDRRCLRLDAQHRGGIGDGGYEDDRSPAAAIPPARDSESLDHGRGVESSRRAVCCRECL